MAKKKLKKSEKRLLIALGVVAFISAIVLYRIYGPQPEPEAVEQTTPSTSTETPTATPASRGGGGGGGSRGGGSRGGSSASSSISNLSLHNKPNDCWVTIGGGVYDITQFIREYEEINPEIAGYCGTYGFEVGFLDENLDLRDFVLENAIKK